MDCKKAAARLPKPNKNRSAEDSRLDDCFPWWQFWRGTSPLLWFGLWLYKLISNYGYSIFRPVFFGFGCMGLLGAYLRGFLSPKVESCGDPLLFSAHYIIPIYRYAGLTEQGTQGGVLLDLLAATLTLLGLVFTFLIGLAVRNLLRLR